MKKNNNHSNKTESTNHEDQVVDLTEQYSQLQTERDQAVAQSQRALADYANLKKRQDKEKQEIGAYVIEGLVSQLLPSFDNLGRAMQHASSEDQKSSLYQGLQMTIQQIDQTLSDLSIQKISAEPGTEFDPNIHEAVEVVKGPKDQIISQLTAGYQYNNRLIRPARVTVGSGE